MTDLDEYIDSDQERPHFEPPEDGQWTHVFRIWFNEEVRLVYVLPTEDVHKVHNNLSRAGNILSIRERRPDE